MDSIRDQVARSYDRALAKKNLQESISARLMLAHAGGLWSCDVTLIAMLQSYVDEPKIVIPDAQSIPHEINPRTLLELVKQRHQEVMNDWLIEYRNLAKIRTAKHV